MLLAPRVSDSGGLIIPDWCLEDTPVEISEITPEGMKIANLDPKLYRKMRRQSYYACKWYPRLIANGVPTIPSLISKSNKYDIRSDLHDLFKQEIDSDSKLRFVRMCGSSPKDIRTPIYGNASQAADDLLRSERTLEVMYAGHYCLMVRSVVNIDIECRCIVSRWKLRAVSVYSFLPAEKRKEYEEKIVEFMDLYCEKIGYNSCVIELGISKDEDSPFPFVIEINSFGVDGFASAGRFDWDTEAHILYNAVEPEFRYPGEYEYTV